MKKFFYGMGFVLALLALGLIGGVENGEPLINSVWAILSAGASFGSFVLGGAIDEH